MKYWSVLSSLLLLVMINGCKKSDKICIEEKLTAAFIFDYPDTVGVNETFDLKVDYVLENSCGEFGEFEGGLSDNTLEVRLKAIYKGCNCEEGYIEKTTSYPIAFTESGNYELKFWVSEENYESYIIVVE